MKNLRFLFLIFLNLLTFSLVSQSNLKDRINEKYKSVKDSLTSNSFTINGRISISSSLNYSFPEKELAKNYKINAQVNLKYKGIDIPIQYVLSNGRSINRFNGPSFRTPKFNITGISPSYKWMTLHLGDRTMAFSKYTYDNLRFKGIGLELNPGSYFLKVFKGNLSPLTPTELNFISNYKPLYARQSWGGHFGYDSKNIKVSGIIFTANDDYRSITQTSEIKQFPKENTVVSVTGTYQPIENIEIKLEKSVSALTSNSYDERIDIKTQSTVYNMLGLFTRKTSSDYNYAGQISIDYKKEKYSIGVGHESIDKGYKSLGSLLYDNNFRNYTINTSFKFKDKIHTTNSFGLRKIKNISHPSENNYKLIFNSSVNYQINKRNNMFANFTNFRQVENLYLRSLNSAEIDSVILSNVNRNISLGYNLTIGAESPYNFAFIASNQNSNTIQYDSIETGIQTKSNMIGISIAKIFAGHNFNLSANWVSNISAVSNTIYSINIGHQVNLKEKFSIQNSLNYSIVGFNEKKVRQLVLSNEITYLLTNRNSVGIDSRIDFNNSAKSFKPFTYYVGLKATYSF